MLKFDSATFLYHDNRGIERATCSLMPGEVVGVVGANGVGKSTFLGLASGALIPQEGTVSLQITDLSGRIKTYDSARGIGYRRHVGYMTDFAPVWAEQTVERYLKARAVLRGERFLRIRRRVTAAMERCGLTEIRRQRIAGLSQGWMRRVALAEALITLPEVLVLDDPFAGMDVRMRENFVTIIREVAVHAHVLISGHDPSLLQGCCQRFILLERAQVVADHLTFEQVTEKLRQGCEE